MKHLVSPRVNERGRTERDSIVTPHKLEGGKRKGKTMRRKRIRNLKPQPTIAQARNALAMDPNAVWDKKRKCLIYNRTEA